MTGLFLASVAAALAASAPQAAEPIDASPDLAIPDPVEDDVADETVDPPGTQTVETLQDRHERMTVPVMIGGQGPFQFMIDTGAQATAVTRTLSDKLELKLIGQATLVGMASRRQVDLVALNGLEFAARTRNNLEVPLVESRNLGVDGILGLDTLQDMRVLIDFRDDTIAVNDADQLGGNRGYDIVVRARRKLGRLIIAKAEIDGITTAIIIDTGAQNSVGNLALHRKMRARRLETIRHTDVNGQDLIGTLDFADVLQIQDIQIRNLPIVFADGPAFTALGFDGKPAMILGMRDLRVFDRVAIDFATRTILFDMPTSAGYRRKMNFGGFASRLREPG